jgi:O-antigen/teichoic acid export membrane protein
MSKSMSGAAGATAELMSAVPAEARVRIVSGMRLTVWLSAISLPFSYGSTILLARTGPEAVGTFGLLSVYIGAALGLFYLGGDAVAIKFIPELDSEKRLSFLVSYFLIACLAVLPWIIAAAIWPHKLHYLLGEQSSTSLQLLLIVLSPLTILASLVGAALKGMLEIGFAQMLSRLVTIASFLVYAGLFFFSRSTLVHSYPAVIWGTYLAFCALSAGLGFRHLWCLNGWRNNWRSLRFFLPRGFWPYTISLQQLSALSFFVGRFDVILVLNFGGLELLGKYVAIITLAESIRLISGFFLGTFLPSLTNTIAARNMAGASDVFHTHLRILFLVSTAASCGLMFLAHSITTLLGAKYTGVAPLIILIALFIGLCTPGGVGGMLLSSIGKQQYAVGVVLGQIALYFTLFVFLWPRWQLTGAVFAYGAGWVVSNAVLIAVARLNSPFPFSVIKEYVAFAFVATGSAFVAHWKVLSIGSGLLVWLIAVGLFVVLARYSFEECTKLLHCFIPLSYFSSRGSAVSSV